MSKPNTQTFKPETEVFDDGLETNIVGVAKHIFSLPPGKPYSIGLQLDHPVDEGQSAEDVLHKMLTMFLLAGVQVKFGSEMTFKALTESQKNVLRQYMWSIGYDPKIYVDEATESFCIEFEPYKVV